MADIYKMDSDYLSAESVYDRTLGKTQSEINGENVNPPSVLNSTRQATLTSGTAQQITSVGGWYQVRAVNGSDSGSCYAYIQSAEASGYIATNSVPNGNWNRAVTPYIYFPVGAKFWARAAFTLASDSGVYFAPEI